MGYTSKFTGAEIDNLLDKVNQGGNGGGVPIVSSEAELDALNLPIGSVASIVSSTKTLVSLRDLYQPTENDIDVNTGSINNIEKFSVVKAVDYTPNNQANSTTDIALMTTSLLKSMLFSYGGNEVNMADSAGVVFSGSTVDYIDRINDELSKEDWLYLGAIATGESLSESDFSEYDKSLKIVQGEDSCVAAQKDFGGFSIFVKGKEFESLSSDVKNKADKLTPVYFRVDHYDWNVNVIPQNFSVISTYETTNNVSIYLRILPGINKTYAWLEKGGDIKISLTNGGTEINWNSNIEWKDGVVGSLDTSKSYLLEFITIVSEGEPTIVIGNITAYNIPES